MLTRNVPIEFDDDGLNAAAGCLRAAVVMGVVFCVIIAALVWWL